MSLNTTDKSLYAIQSGTWNITNISGTISLPTGAATESTLSTLNGKITACNTGAVVISSGTVTANAGSGTFAVSAASLPLPSGASTSANQTTEITSLQLIDDIVHSGDAAVSKYALIGAVLDDVSTGTVTENQGQSLRMSSRRALLVEGVASGTAFNVNTHAITIASGGVASGAIASGALASGAFASGSIAAGAVAAGATSFVKLEDAASANADAGVACLAVRKASPANTSDSDGDYEFLQMSAGRVWASATIDAALPAGTNAIGKLAANSGVDIGDVDVTSIVPGTGTTSLGKAEDGGHTSGDTGVFMLAVRNDAFAARSGTDADYTPISVDSAGRVQTYSCCASGAALSNVSSSASSVTVLSSNTSRKKAVIVNDSTSDVYLKYGTTASTTDYTYKLRGGDTLEEIHYTGRIDGIWSSANGTARVTEIT